MSDSGGWRVGQDALDGVAASLEKLLGTDRVLRDRRIGELTTYRTGGAAAILVEIASGRDLEAVATAIRYEPVPVLVLGRGSNTLVADQGFPGLVLVLGPEMASLDITGGHVVAGAALSMPQLARRTAAAGLSGLQWAVGIPGSVGGALAMNAGCHGSDVASVLSYAKVFNLAAGEWSERGKEELGYGYRCSDLDASEVVVSASFDLVQGDPGRLREEIAEIVSWRRRHQPGGSNAGSVFRNPNGDSAGRLVEAAGLKGARIGAASVSGKHANFIQCDDGGSARDVKALIELVRNGVGERLGVWLDLELRLVGFGKPDDVRSSASSGGAPLGDVSVECSVPKAEVEVDVRGRAENER